MLICLPSPVAASASVQPAELQHRLRRVSLLQQGMGCFFFFLSFFLQVGFVPHKEQLVSACWVFHLLAHLQNRIRTSVRFSPSPWKWLPRSPGTEGGGGAGRAGKCGTPWGERPTEGRPLRRRSSRTVWAWTWEQPPVLRGEPYLRAAAQRPTAVHGSSPLRPIAPSPPSSAVVLPVAVWGHELCSNRSNQIWLSGI